MTSTDIFVWAIIVVYYVGYGLFALIATVLPGILIGGAILLGFLFVRKLVLDAVREAKK